MALEIERKFLVKNLSFLEEVSKTCHIKQGFLNSDKNRVVRVRCIDEKAYLTIKGISNTSGTSREEWEYEIKKEEAEELLLICEPTLIQKKRHYIKKGVFQFEVDVFENENKGLIIAEIELEDENQKFEKPDWLGNEVTGDQRYYNSYLSKHPYDSWP